MANSLQPSASSRQQPGPAPDLSAYAGCWVAMVGEEVAGVGATADAAQLAAHRSRERIRATIWVPPSVQLPSQPDSSGASPG